MNKEMKMTELKNTEIDSVSGACQVGICEEMWPHLPGPQFPFPDPTNQEFEF